MDLMCPFEAAGLTSMRFHGPAVPSRAVREVARLPYPLKNYGEPE